MFKDEIKLNCFQTEKTTSSRPINKYSYEALNSLVES